ncbi:MAG: apolipoprotein N-acyltransferase [Alteromonadaceae bacterium]|nr:apolipoprotein N-acyltransferase [Alteromonadaceae bacterium]
MPDRPRALPALVHNLALILAGAAQTLSFSPFYLWPLGLVSLLAVLYLTKPTAPEKLFRDGWLVGLGLFGSGTSWVYVSIHDYGMTSVPVAAALTLVFVAGLALFPALGFWLWGKLTSSAATRLWLFPAVWVLTDWVRGFLFTGFPWLYLGTSQVDGPLAPWAPVIGVHGVTLLLAASATLLYGAFVAYRQRSGSKEPAVLLCLAVLPWLTAWPLGSLNWTEREPRPISFAAMQGNIPQQIKWEPAHLRDQLVQYLTMTEGYWDRDLILWPETAIPVPSPDAGPIVDRIEEKAAEHGTTLLTGIPWFGYSEELQRETFHNSMTVIGDGDGFYHKQKLVPFGEYVPLEVWLRGLIGFFDLPMSSFSPGPAEQALLSIGGRSVNAFICYEIAYPDFVAAGSRGTDYLVTVSNDAWFGNSIAPLQHLQLARMRALETSRFVLRGTNNGVTALIDEHGQVLQSAPRFEVAVLSGELYPVKGATPFMRWQSWPVLVLLGLILGAAKWLKRKSRKG